MVTNTYCDGNQHSRGWYRHLRTLSRKAHRRFRPTESNDLLFINLLYQTEEQVAIERTSSNPKPKHVREGSTERIRLEGMMHCTIFQEHF